MNNFSNQYCNILSQIYNKGTEETNKRTGKKTRALPGIHFQVDLEKEFPLLTARKIRIQNFVAEMMWFVAGKNNVNDWLNSKTKIWDAFARDNGTIETAYGYRWRFSFDRDQLWETIATLRKDPSSRQCVVVTWDASSDGLLSRPKKNIPCPYTFTVNIIGGRLNLHNVVRSNDMVLGLPTDVAGFAFLQLILAHTLGVRPGIYSHSISHAHIYEDHYDAVKKMILRNRPQSGGLKTVPAVNFNDYAKQNMFANVRLLDDYTFLYVMNTFNQAYDGKFKEAIKNLIIAM